MRPVLRALVLITALCAAACGQDHGMDNGHDMNNMAGDLAGIEVTGMPWAESRLATDVNDDAHIVEVNLDARATDLQLLPGGPTQFWTYNGSVPGPRIEVQQGDQVIVHLTNNLPEPTSLHWHGVRLQSDMDGVMGPNGHIPPGGRADYIFEARDPGLFWFHPHVDSAHQVARGLYGLLVVRPASEPALATARERIIAISDVAVEPDGGYVVEDGGMTTMAGREGNLILVNGVPSPEFQVAPGARERWRLVNASASRYYDLVLTSGTLTQIGSDGGLLARPVPLRHLLLTPGERADVVVETDMNGRTAELIAQRYDRGHGATSTDVRVLTVLPGPGMVMGLPPLPQTLRSPTVLPEAVQEQSLELGEVMQMGAGMSATFTINGAAYPNVPMLHATLGSSQHWTIRNDSEMDHPFHLHGFFFHPLLADGAADESMGWKDTYNIPAKTTRELLVQFDGYPGEWMYHCHILDHAELGMMAEITVDDAP